MVKNLDNCFALCAPAGPGTPFGTTGLILIDSLRIITMLIGMVVIVWTPRLVLQAPSIGQQCRLASQAMFCLIVIGTEVDHMGDYAHYRLYVSFFAVVLMLYGLTRLNKETPPRTRSKFRQPAE
jgi:hypothetical protein